MAVVTVRVCHRYDEAQTHDESTTDLLVADGEPWGYGNDYPMTLTRSGWYLLGHTGICWERLR